jgi:hypothetical protein
VAIACGRSYIVYTGSRHSVAIACGRSYIAYTGSSVNIGTVVKRVKRVTG